MSGDSMSDQPTPQTSTRLAKRPKFGSRTSRQATNPEAAVSGMLGGRNGPLRRLLVSNALVSGDNVLETRKLRHLAGWGIPGVCVSTLLHQLEGLGWQITNPDRQSDNVTEYFTWLFKYANDGMGGANTLFSKLAEDTLACQTGGFVEVVRNFDGIPTALYSIDGETIRLTREPETPYAQTFFGMDVAYFGPTDLLQITWRPFTEWSKMGLNRTPVQIAYDYINVLAMGDEYNKRTLTEDVPSGILNLGEQFDRRTALEWKEVWDAEMSSDPRLNKFGIVWGTNKIDFQQFSIPPKDMAFSDTALWYAMLITAAFELTPLDIGLTATRIMAGAAAEQQMSLSKRRGLRALLSKLEEGVQRLILPPGYTFKFESIDSTDQRDRAAIAQMETQAIAQLVSALGPAGLEEARAKGIISSTTSLDEAAKWLEEARQMQRDQQEQQAKMAEKQIEIAQQRGNGQTSQDTNAKRDYGSRQPNGQKGKS